MARPLPSNRLGLRSFSREPLEINRPFGPELKAVFSSGRKGPGGEPNARALPATRPPLEPMKRQSSALDAL
jgi:hypothetical protein